VPLRRFREVWLQDFEFGAPPGGRPEPRCLAARELSSGRLVRLWLDGQDVPAPPFDTGPDVLHVAYYASAEWGCYLALGWPLPACVLDLYAEFRCLTNGRHLPHGAGLLGALAHFGLDMSAVEKEELRALALRGGSYLDAERQALLDYAQADADALAHLLPRMLPQIDLPRALAIRGRYTLATARMERNGVPLDAEALAVLRENWDPIKARVAGAVNRLCGVFVPTGRLDLRPDSRFGAAVLETARQWGLDPHRLAEVALMLWRQEREGTAEVLEARRVARRATGLSPARVRRLEEAGRDHLDVPGLDVQARELAGAHPALGIGRGYDGEDGYDDTDHAARLWDRLRELDPRPRPRHDPGLLRDAAEHLCGLSRDDDLSGPLRFSARHFAAYLHRHGIPWPRLPSGKPALDEATFRTMAKVYPAIVGPVREARHALGQMRLADLACGSDGRNRVLLSAFRSRTGRNQPSNSRFIFGPSCWLRSLIAPGPGRALAYVDWSQQELAIAARLSGDERMQECYRSGDFYLTFGRMAGAVPAGATKETHGRERDQFKVVALGVLYGLGADSLAAQLGVPACRGRDLLEMHRRTFRRFWEWSDTVVLAAQARGWMRTCFGWRLHVGPDANPRSLRNWPMQSHGAEMMRVAAILMTERGLCVCAPVHDAFLIEAPEAGIGDAVGQAQRAMVEASAAVLPGFPLRTEAKVVRHPDRYSDPRGAQMWGLVWGLIDGATPGRIATPPLAGLPPPSILISSVS
jgi:hypothetical protein